MDTPIAPNSFLRRARIASQQMSLLRPKSVLTAKDGRYWGVMDGFLCGEFKNPEQAQTWMQWFANTPAYTIYTIADVDKFYRTAHRVNRGTNTVKIDVDSTEFGDLRWLDIEGFLAQKTDPWTKIEDFKSIAGGQYEVYLPTITLHIPHNTIVYVKKENTDGILNRRTALRFR